MKWKYPTGESIHAHRRHRAGGGRGKVLKIRDQVFLFSKAPLSLHVLDQHPQKSWLLIKFTLRIHPEHGRWGKFCCLWKKKYLLSKSAHGAELNVSSRHSPTPSVMSEHTAQVQTLLWDLTALVLGFAGPKRVGEMCCLHPLWVWGLSWDKSVSLFNLTRADYSLWWIWNK